MNPSEASGPHSEPATSASPSGAESGPGATPAMSMFARKLAHDLNNFATVVRTYSELLLTDLPAGSTREDVTEIHRAADAMVVYLQRVSRFARASTLRPAAVDLMPLVRAMAEEFAEARDDAPVSVEGLTSATVYADPHWLRDVLREIVRNAREASPAGGRVTLAIGDGTAPGAAGWVIVDVQDEGPGFAASVAANAEDPFVTTKDGVRGAGFGLTLAAAFAQASEARLVRGRQGDRTSVALWLRRHEG